MRSEELLISCSSAENAGAFSFELGKLRVLMDITIAIQILRTQQGYMNDLSGRGLKPIDVLWAFHQGPVGAAGCLQAIG